MRLSPQDADLRISDRFDSATMHALGKGELDVIWHPRFYSVEVCEAVLPAIRTACEASDYTLTNDLQSLGTSMGEAEQSLERTAMYFATASQTRQMIRKDLFAPFLSPIDLIRLLADEAWPQGAVIARSKGRPMLSGIVRRWVAGGQANPHIDQKDLPILADLDLKRRIAVNVYLATPGQSQGGDIEFWGRIEDESEYEAMKRSDYGVNRTNLGVPPLSISPSPGDLIAFDASRLHGVRGLERGERVTAACFLGVRGKDYPLYQFA